LARKYRRRQVSTLLRRLGAKASKSNQYDASETGGPLNNPFIAISSNNIEALRSIVSRGINLEPTNVAGNTPLLEAAKLDRLMMSRILIKGGARVNVRSSKGWTPLMFAAQRGNHALARDLLDAGAIPDVINPQGMTAMDLAEKHGYMDVAVFIRRHITRSKRR
jgi:ankyrin repeat protein